MFVHLNIYELTYFFMEGSFHKLMQLCILVTLDLDMRNLKYTLTVWQTPDN